MKRLLKMFCGPDSLDARFVKELGFVRSYVLNDGKLFMATLADGAILEFAAAGGSDYKRLPVSTGIVHS